MKNVRGSEKGAEGAPRGELQGRHSAADAAEAVRRKRTAIFVLGDHSTGGAGTIIRNIPGAARRYISVSTCSRISQKKKLQTQNYYFKPSKLKLILPLGFPKCARVTTSLIFASAFVCVYGCEYCMYVSLCIRWIFLHRTAVRG